MLNIKPVLHVDDEGHLIPLEKVRGRKASIGAMLRHMEETAIRPEEQTILISHADCLEDAEHLRTLVENQFHPRQILITEIGPIVGAHASRTEHFGMRFRPKEGMLSGGLVSNA